jgi:hypothetical protein
MKIAGSSILVICLAFLYSGCQHNEIEESDLIVTEGYIDININGISADNIQLTESVRLSVYPVGKEELYSGVSGTENDLHFSVGRQNDLSGSDYLIMDFNYHNGIVSNITADMNYKKLLENKSTLLYSAQTDGNIKSSNIVIDEYDPSTGTLAGNFTFLVSSQTGSESSKDAIVNGEFYVIVTRIVY